MKACFDKADFEFAPPTGQSFCGHKRGKARSIPAAAPASSGLLLPDRPGSRFGARRCILILKGVRASHPATPEMSNVRNCATAHRRIGGLLPRRGPAENLRQLFHQRKHLL